MLSRLRQALPQWLQSKPRPALEHYPQTPLQNINKRMRQSDFEASYRLHGEVKTLRMAEHFYLGNLDEPGQPPLLLHHDIVRQPMLFLGATGTGKSSLMANIAYLERLPYLQSNGLFSDSKNTATVIIDPKGDKYLRQCAQMTAREAGVPFYIFTLNPLDHEPTMSWNFLLHMKRYCSEVQSFRDMLLDSLGLNYGSEYGASFFTALNALGATPLLSTEQHFETLIETTGELITTYRQNPDFPDTWTELNNRFHQRGGRLPSDLRERLADFGSKLQDLAPFTQLSTANNLPHIDFSQLLTQGGVAYFLLDHDKYKILAPTVGKLVMAALFHAIKFQDTARKSDSTPLFPPRHLSLLVDEAHKFAGQSLQSLITTTRAAGMGIKLAMQDLSQLKGINLDIQKGIESNTTTKIYCSVVSAEDKKTLVDTSGTEITVLRATTKGRTSGLAQSDDVDNLADSWQESYRDTEVIATKLTINDINRVNGSRRDLCIVHLMGGVDSFANLEGVPVVMRSPYYPLFYDLDKVPWPKIPQVKKQEQPKPEKSIIEKAPFIVPVPPVAKAPAPAVPKRPRGRPRKNPVASPMTANDAKATPLNVAALNEKVEELFSLRHTTTP